MIRANSRKHQRIAVYLQGEVFQQGAFSAEQEQQLQQWHKQLNNMLPPRVGARHK